MKVGISCLIFIVICSCGTNHSNEIVVPKLNAGFYSNALSEINDRLAANPTDFNLVEQKLYYCEQLDWPTTCISALDLYRSRNGMSNKLFSQYLEYYVRHKRYKLLVETIDRWKDQFTLDESHIEEYIAGLVISGRKRQARKELQVYLSINKQAEHIRFAAIQYLSLSDTLMALYNLGKLSKSEPEDSLMFPYGKMLVEIGHESKGLAILERYTQSTSLSEESALALAFFYDKVGLVSQARNIIKPFASKDTLAYLVAAWYEKEQLWDSAIVYVDKVLQNDTSNTKAWWKMARIYENRGWLSASIPFYQKVLNLNPKDSSVINQMNLVRRKIAYLQRRNFEENRLPVLDFEPIKIKN